MGDLGEVLVSLLIYTNPSGTVIGLIYVIQWGREKWAVLGLNWGFKSESNTFRH